MGIELGIRMALTMSDVTTDRVLDWLDSEIAHQESYHDHKERMAWTALAFYVPGVLLLTNAVASDLGSGGRVFGTLLLIILVRAVAMFVNMQFEMRWHAADLANAIRRARGEVTVGKTLSQDDLETTEWTGGGWVLPRFVAAKAELSRTDRSKDAFHRALGHFLDGRWAKIDARMRTELAGYIILAITTIVVVVAIWLPEFRSNSQ